MRADNGTRRQTAARTRTVRLTAAHTFQADSGTCIWVNAPRSTHPGPHVTVQLMISLLRYSLVLWDTPSSHKVCCYNHRSFMEDLCYNTCNCAITAHVLFQHVCTTPDVHAFTAHSGCAVCAILAHQFLQCSSLRVCIQHDERFANNIVGIEQLQCLHLNLWIECVKAV